MKFCTNCGMQMADDAKFCVRCGKAAEQSSQTWQWESPSLSKDQQLINTLSARVKINGIIWLVIAGIQILIGLLGAWVTLIVGVMNIISAIQDIKISKRILSNQINIVKTYQPLTNAIITLIYNIVIGGVIGVIGSIYYLIFVRGFVMENKEQFLKMVE